MKIERLKVKNLKVDDQYQRIINQNNVKKIIENYDENQLDPLRVCKRGEEYYIIDGQHRALALIKLNIEYVECIIVTLRNERLEADLFTRQNQRSSIFSTDLYKARLFYGDKLYVDINNIVEKNGFKVKKSSGAFTISAVDALKTSYRRFGINTLDRALYVLGEIYTGEGKSLTAEMIKGFAYLLHRVNIENKLLIEKLKSYPLQRLQNTSRTLRTNTGVSEERSVAMAILELYNDKKRNRVYAEL